MEAQLIVERRELKGKGPARRLRAAGYIPAVLYGHGIDTQAIKVKSDALKEVLRGTGGRNVLVDLTVEGDGKKENHLVMLREVQKHPFKEKILHVDFYKVAREEKIKVAVPVELVGESVGVKEGGILQQNLWEIEVECLPGDVPEKIEVNITELDVGDHLVVSDIGYIPNAEIQNDPVDVLLSIQAPRVEEVVEEEEELIAEEALVEGEAEEAPEAEGEKAEEGAAEETKE